MKNVITEHFLVLPHNNEGTKWGINQDIYSNIDCTPSCCIMHSSTLLEQNLESIFKSFDRGTLLYCSQWNQNIREIL